MNRIFKGGPVMRQRVRQNKILQPGESGTPVGTAQAFLKTMSNAYASQMASYGQYSRLARMSDYQEMDSFSIVNSALSIYADEVTNSDENGKVLKIESENREIQDALYSLFYDVLNIEFNAWTWIRNMVKYGEQFLLLDHHIDYGVMNLLPMPVNEVEREEGYDENDPMAYRFRWVTQGNREIPPWEVIHLRLLTNDNFLPYGTSILESIRRVWRQLILLEDAVMVYRIVRSPERRVFYIDVGGIPPHEVPQYIEKVKSQFARSSVVDESTGELDLRHGALSSIENYYIPSRGDSAATRIETLPGGQYPVRKDTTIPLLDGRNITIEELAKEYEEDKENWVYSVQESTNKVVPGKVVWCGKNYTCDKIHRVWLDDDSYIDMAPEHPVVMRDGSKKRADQLDENDSVMPFRTKLSTNKKDRIEGYHMIRDPQDDEWRYVHKIVGYELGGKEEALKRSKENSAVIHHVDICKTNNNPDNLKWMGFWEHRDYHIKNLHETLHSPEVKEKTKKILSSDRMKALRKKKANDPNDPWCQWIHSDENKRRFGELNHDPRIKEMTRKRNSERWDDSEYRRLHSGENNGNAKRLKKIKEELFADYTLEDLRDFCVENNLLMMKDVVKHENFFLKNKLYLRKFIRENGIDSWTEFANKYLGESPLKNNWKNHKIKKVEVLDEVDDVYCMTVVGPNGEDDRHNFAALSKGINVEKGCMNGIFVSNTGDVEDLEYIRDKLFAGLKVPKPYITYTEEVCLHPDTKIDLLDGRSLTIEQIFNEYSVGKENWVYSCTEDGQIKPGKITLATPTKKVKTLYKIILDNDEEILCTDNHPFMKRDGSYNRADELSVNDSLMPLYKKISSKKEKDFADGYEKIYDLKNSEWVFTHRLVSNECDILQHESVDKENHHVVHHMKPWEKNNKLNNSPNNLMFMGKKAHALYHAYEANPLLKEESREKLKQIQKTKEYKENLSNGVQKAWDSDNGSRRRRISEVSREKKLYKYMLKGWREAVDSGKIRYDRENNPRWVPRPEFEDIVECVKRGIIGKKDIAAELDCSVCGFFEVIRNNGFDSYYDFITTYDTKTRRGRRIKYLDLDKYASIASTCATKREFYKKIDCSATGFCNYLKRNSINPVEWIGQYLNKNNHKVKSIEIVELDEEIYVYDLTVDNYHNFALSSGVFVHNSGKSTLSQMDIVFAKIVQRIQRTFIAEMNKIAIIHLYTMGYSEEDITNFEIKMSNPSTVQEIQNLELWRTRLEVATVAQEGIFDRYFLYKEFFKLNDDQIAAIEEGRKRDRMLDLQLENMQLEATEAAEAAAAEEVPAEEPEPEAGAEADRELQPTPEPEAGDEEERPITAGKDPNQQRVAPNELKSTRSQKNKTYSKPSDDLKNRTFSMKKNALDPKDDLNYLRRIATTPFGENAEDFELDKESIKEFEDIDEHLFKKQRAQLKGILNKVEGVSEKLETSRLRNKRKNVLNESKYELKYDAFDEDIDDKEDDDN